MILDLTAFDKKKKSMKHCDCANCFSSFFMAPLYRLALSVAGFVVVAMTTINAEESACCGDQLSADSIDM